jgi:hypothetical protein
VIELTSPSIQPSPRPRNAPPISAATRETEDAEGADGAVGVVGVVCDGGVAREAVAACNGGVAGEGADACDSGLVWIRLAVATADKR